MRTTRLLAAGAAAALTTGVVAATVAEASTRSDVSHQGVSGFDHPRQNAYFPLRPGTVFRYRGSDEGERFRETLTITRHHKTIRGVRTTVVRDVLRRADGSLAEKTTDWYAPDDKGNVWYFGERTATYDESGAVDSREGSWQAGEHGARRGIIMPADPRPTDAYRQEFRSGHAEDQAWIVQRGFTTKVPYGTVRHAVRSFEWTRLEPGVVSEKVYGPGLGIVKERDVAGGHERFSLVSVTRR